MAADVWREPGHAGGGIRDHLLAGTVPPGGRPALYGLVPGKWKLGYLKLPSYDAF